MCAALVVADPPSPIPVWFKALAGSAGVLLAMIALRIFTMAVVVTAKGEVVVRSVVRTIRVPGDEVAKLVSPDWDTTAAVPRLVRHDGSVVKLTPILRVKNRAWGVEKVARRNLDGLARRLGVPIERGTSDFPFG